MKWIGGYTRMGNLKFDDIDEWTPSSISIVDEPSHPCCHFEVYHDDEEYVKKSIEINEGERMVDQNQPTEEPMVQAPVSFFERLLGRTVGKAEEVPEPPVKEDKEEKPKPDLEARIAKLEEKVAKLEEAEKPEEEKEVTPGAVTKSEGEGEGEGETSEAENEAEEAATEDEIVDEEEVVVKSRSIDPDNITVSDSTDKSLVERAGRKTNGMTW